MLILNNILLLIAMIAGIAILSKMDIGDKYTYSFLIISVSIFCFIFFRTSFIYIIVSILLAVFIWKYL